MSKKISEIFRFGELWEKYETEVLPENCSNVQLVECKNAFYAGAAGLLTMLLNNTEEKGTLFSMEEVLESTVKELADQLHSETA